MPRLTDDKNIVLIGMPGCGKSTVGVLLAKATSRSFIDTDVLIQAKEGRRLQDIIDTEGTKVFRKIEEREILALARHGREPRAHVIATGGSVVYSEKAMAHLRSNSVSVYLHLPFDMLEKRLTNLDSRGIVMESGQTLRDLFDERRPLYRCHADITIDCTGLTHEQVVDAIVEAMEK